MYFAAPRGGVRRLGTARRRLSTMSSPKANLEVLPRSIQFVLGLGVVALLAFPFVGTDF